MGLTAKAKGVAAVTAAVIGFHAYQAGAFTAPATASGTAARLDVHVSGGTLDCAGLERLWEAAGGSRGEAFTAAEIAMAESGGRQYATNTNGGRSTDRGFWQINDAAHGSLSTYDALGNAKAAVLISHDGTDWFPWVTFTRNLYQGRCQG